MKIASPESMGFCLGICQVSLMSSFCCSVIVAIVRLSGELTTTFDGFRYLRGS